MKQLEIIFLIFLFLKIHEIPNIDQYDEKG